MGITHILTEAGLIDERDRRRATDYVTDRLERAADVVDDLSTRVRNGTRERAFDSVDVDGLVERAVTDLIGDPDVLAEELLDEHDLSYGTDDPSERALEAFLRRYDLDGARLNERTREAIRDELIAQLDVDPERVLERLGADRSTDSEPNAGMDPSIGHVLTDVRSRLRAELDIEGDQPLHRALDDVLQRDAVEVAHGVERALAEGLARSEEDGRPGRTNTGVLFDRPPRWRSRR
ncbi:hypothetical protein [Halalkalicoccus salilacus]|uniref:hypothetical protein n=1 Tax=Halalkalicoccus sp. GCM10025704 TaxID=3252662 RepID=UPI003617ACEE